MELVYMVHRPFGGLDLYQKGVLISTIRPYMDSWTYTYKGSEEKFIIRDEGEELSLEQVLEHVKGLLISEKIDKENESHYRKMLFGEY